MIRDCKHRLRFTIVTNKGWFKWCCLWYKKPCPHRGNRKAEACADWQAKK